MPSFRRPRSLEPSSEAAASGSSQSQPNKQRGLSPSSLAPGRRVISESNAKKTRAKDRMKRAASLALEVVQIGSRLAGDVTSDVAIPGLSIGLEALAEILRKIQTMNATITGVQELHTRILDVVEALRNFRSQPDGQQLPPQMLERMSRHETKWQHIGERAKKIKSHGRIKRFLTSDADAKALQSLVDEMSSSIQDDMLEGIRNIERDVHHVRNRVEAVNANVENVRGDVAALNGNVEMVHVGLVETLSGLGAVREDLGDVGEDVEVVLEGLSAVEDDVADIGENVEVVIEELTSIQGNVAEVGENVEVVLQVVEDGVEALQDGVDLVASNMEALQDKVAAVDANVQQLKLQVAKAIAATLDNSFLPMYAKMAPYNANEVRRSCLEGTRVDFLKKIYAWITTACERGEAIPGGGIVMWINGLGGTGKTTVAHSVAEWCDKEGVLAGSFFCSRADSDCSNPNLVFSSLCRQLCEHHEPFKVQIEAVLKRLPDIASYGLHRQFEELVVLPLEALDGPFPRSVFVLDALDELNSIGPNAAKSTILSVVAKFAPRIAKFLLLVMTSRPEADISALFEERRKDSLKDKTTTLLMHDIPIDIALKDIRRYIDYEFEAKVEFLPTEPNWPSDEEKDALAEQSQGLFVYVATAIKFVMDKAFLDPKGQMSLLTTKMPKAPDRSQSTPYQFLFTLYTTIMVSSYERASPELRKRLQDVLGAVVLAQEALSTLSVARLVGLDVSTVRATLTGLHSVLHVPANDHDLIRIIHPTFPEFLLHPPPEPASQSSNVVPASGHLHLEPAERHWYLFSRCLEVMLGALKRDMIGIRYPGMFQSEVENLKERIATAIEPHVRYACRFWADHLRDGAGCAASLDICDLFWKFVHKLVLYWIETCSLLDAMDKVMSALDAAQRICQMLGGRFADLAPLLADCRRFTATYSPCIHAAPLQIYHSALSLSPTASHVRTAYTHEREHALLVEHGAHVDWAPCLDTFAGHGGKPVQGVAFAPDGSCFVTGGGDNQVRIWKTATRTPVLVLGGHSDWVRCVAFSPDGLHVASGGDDRRVFVWQASSGDRVHTLGGHSDWVHSVAYSGDGRRILSATLSGEVKLWDAGDGRCLLTLEKTGNDTRQVGISLDGGVIARGGRASVSMHNVSTAASEALEFPDTVGTCTFSPDGRYIAARSEHVIRVWAWPDKTLVRSIDVSDWLFGRLAFSRDGTLIGCGSLDGPVHLWKVASQDPPHTLRGHTQYVNDLAFSPDDSQVVSVARDGMIRVWDRTLSSIPSAEHTAPAPPTPAPGPPRFALIRSGNSPIALLHLPTLGIDAKHFALGAQMPYGVPTATLFPDAASAWDTALQHLADWDGSRSSRIWTSFVGQQHAQLSKRPFAISLNGSLMAYPSLASGKVVRVCDLRTGTVVATLTGHTKDVCSIAFSPDSTRIATGSEDHSVRVWDTLTGTLVCGHTKHQHPVPAVSFSHDGCLVASGSHGRTVRIFEVATRRVVRVLKSYRDWMMHVMFAADNTHVVALNREDWVYIWDVTTGARLREFSLHDHDHLRRPIFSPDDTGILIDGADGTLRTVSLWQPGTRAWPACHVTEDGWVYALSPGKSHRLLLLPPEWRTVLHSDGPRLYVVETDLVQQRERMIVLNVSQIEAYIDSLDE